MSHSAGYGPIQTFRNAYGSSPGGSGRNGNIMRVEICSLRAEDAWRIMGRGMMCDSPSSASAFALIISEAHLFGGKGDDPGSSLTWTSLSGDPALIPLLPPAANDNPNPFRNAAACACRAWV